MTAIVYMIAASFFIGLALGWFVSPWFLLLSAASFIIFYAG